MNSRLLGQGGGRGETFRFSLLQITNCFSFHFSKRPLVLINFTKYANYVVLFLGDWILPTNYCVKREREREREEKSRLDRSIVQCGRVHRDRVIINYRRHAQKRASAREVVSENDDDDDHDGGWRRFWRTVKPQQVLLEDQFQFDDDDDDVETRFLDPRRGSSAPFSPPVAEETTRWDGKEYFDEIRRESEQHEEVAR